MFPIRDHNPSHTFPLITLGIIGITAYMFFLEISAVDMETFIRQYALIPAAVDFSDLTTLMPFITSIFLHGGWLHIISNVWFLWIFGDNIESALGKIQYGLFYLFCGVVAGIVQYITMPATSVPMLGASGAVAGVLGAYLALYPRHKIDTLIPFGFFVSQVQIPAGIMLGYWFLIQVISGVGSFGMQDIGGVAFWAHAGGFVTGWILIRLLPHASHSTQ